MVEANYKIIRVMVGFCWKRLDRTLMSGYDIYVGLNSRGMIKPLKIQFIDDASCQLHLDIYHHDGNGWQHRFPIAYVMRWRATHCGSRLGDTLHCLMAR